MASKKLKRALTDRFVVEHGLGGGWPHKTTLQRALGAYLWLTDRGRSRVVKH